MRREARAAALALALLAAGALPASAQESSLRLNPYAGWFHYDESSFEKAFQSFDVATDPIYGLRLAIAGLGNWSLDLAYGRAKVTVRYPTPDASELSPADATIDTCLEDDALHNIELSGGVEIPL